MFQDGFPNNLRDDVAKVVGMIPFSTYSNVSIGATEQTIEYSRDSIEIKFPYRIYFIDVPEEALEQLNLRQKMILHCIYSRSCDGFVRQKHLQSLLLMDYEDWTIPYIVKICDEYVVEILQMIYDMLRQQDTERIKRFCIENAESFYKSYDRMVSYWNEYYRFRYKKLQDYVGRKLFKECFGYSRSLERKV